MKDAPLTCPVCGTGLEATDDPLHGLCPKCLLAFIVEGPVEHPLTETQAAKTIRSAHVPNAEVASRLEGRELGNYVVLGQIGRGGMGVVYKARQKGLERHVALKVLSRGLQASDADVERFFREARAAAKLQHPNIVPIHEVSSEGGVYFFAMDLVEGRTLTDVVRSRQINPRQALEIVREVALAVDYAHANGIIHRDLKPGNVMIDRQGNPKVMDFGLAKDISGETSKLTHSGEYLGSPVYMSPEQAEGRSNEAGPLCDVYGLGAILYECLTGGPPYEGPTIPAILRRILYEDPAPPRRLNPAIQRDIETICLKALEKIPQKRYASAGALANDIGRFLNGEIIEARPVSVAERCWRTAKKHRGVWAPVTVALLLGIVASAVAVGDRIHKARQVRNALAQAAAHEAQGDLKAAQDSYAAAEILDPESAEVRIGLVRATGKLEAKEKVEAQKALEEANRTLSDAFVFRAEAALKDGNLLDAIAYLSAARDKALTPRCEAFALALRAPRVMFDRTLRGHSGSIRSLAFSPDGRLLVSLDAGGSARVWDVFSGKEVLSATLLAVQATCAAFDSTGQIVAFGMKGGRVELRRVSDGNVRLALDLGSSYNQTVEGLAFNGSEALPLR